MRDFTSRLEQLKLTIADTTRLRAKSANHDSAEVRVNTNDLKALLDSKLDSLIPINVLFKTRAANEVVRIQAGETLHLQAMPYNIDARRRRKANKNTGVNSTEGTDEADKWIPLTVAASFVYRHGLKSNTFMRRAIVRAHALS